MAESLGNIKGQITLDVKQALAAYTKTRLAHLNTVTALHTGAGALQASGAAMAGAGTLMVGAFVGAIGKAAEFEKRLDAFGAVSNSTTGQMEAVRKKALQLGKDTIYSANDIADAFIELGKQGRSAGDIVNGLGDATASLASAGDLPLANAAEVLSNTLTTYALKAEDAVKVSDRIAGAANASSVDVMDLAVSFKYVSGIAASMGLSFEDTNTALAVLGNYGIKGSTAGTSLRQVLVALAGPTKKSAAELMDLGIITKDGSNAFYDATGKLKPLPDVLDTLSKSLEGMNAKEKYDALSKIFPIRAMPTILNLLKSGKTGFEDMAKAIDRSSAADVAAKRLDNLSGDIEILKGNLETMAIEAGGSFQKFARGVVQGVTNILAGFASLPQNLQSGILGFIALAGAGLILIGSLGLFAGAILNIIALAIQLGPVFTGIRAVMAAWRTAIVATAAAQWILNSAILANPITWIIVAIVAVVAALIWFFTQTKLGKAIWANFVSFLQDAWSNIVSFATSVWGNLGNFFTGLWNGIKTVATNVWNGIVAFFVGVWNGIVQSFLQFTLLGLIISNFSQIVAFIRGVWNGIVGFFAAIWAAIMVTVQPFLDFWVAYVVPLLQAYAGLIIAVFNYIMLWIAFIWNAIVSLVTPIITVLVGVIVSGFNNVMNFITTVMNVVWAVIQVVWGAISNYIMTIVRVVVATVVAIWGALVGLVSGIFNRIAAVIRTTWAVIKALISAAVRGVVTVIQVGWAVLVGIVTGIFNRVANAVKGPLGTMLSFISTIRGKIIGFFAGAGSWLVSAGRSIITGFINGIKSMLGGITGVLKGITNMIPKVKGPPERDKILLTPAGISIMEGFMRGIGAMRKPLQRQLGRLSDDIPSMFGSPALSDMAASISATRTMAITASTPDINPLQAVVDRLTDEIKEFMEEPRSVSLEVNNPKPEKASDTLPRTLRQVSEMV